MKASVERPGTFSGPRNSSMRSPRDAMTGKPDLYFPTDVTPERLSRAIGKLRKEARDEIDRLPFPRRNRKPHGVRARRRINCPKMPGTVTVGSNTKRASHEPLEKEPGSCR